MGSYVKLYVYRFQNLAKLILQSIFHHPIWVAGCLHNLQNTQPKRKWGVILVIMFRVCIFL